MTGASRVEPSRQGEARLRALAERAGRQLEDAPAKRIVAWAAQTFGDRLCVTSSMADAVVTYLTAQALPGVSVLFVDTGYHFVETLGTRDAVAATYPVQVRSVRPVQSVAEQDATYGEQLYARDPDRCCALRKVAPLAQALAGFDAWVSGLRRDESPTRADTPVVQWDTTHRMVKVNPIARWSEHDVQEYVAAHDVLVNPLLAAGYPSIGCAPCTRRPDPGADPRSGRWPGLAKTECGIHQ